MCGVTRKGLEPEMQRLITQHQSELQAVKQQAADACQQRLHELMVQVRGPCSPPCMHAFYRCYEP